MSEVWAKKKNKKYHNCPVGYCKINTRIFHTLLSSGKLPSPQDVQHYLAYTVKVTELSTKLTLCSVLKYDKKYCQVQAVCNYPCSYDSNHLHTVLLKPLALLALLRILGFLGLNWTLQCEMALQTDKLEDLHQVVTTFLHRCRALLGS